MKTLHGNKGEDIGKWIYHSVFWLDDLENIWNRFLLDRGKDDINRTEEVNGLQRRSNKISSSVIIHWIMKEIYLFIKTKINTKWS